jgi:hypothetical protein
MDTPHISSRVCMCVIVEKHRCDFYSLQENQQSALRAEKAGKVESSPYPVCTSLFFFFLPRSLVDGMLCLAWCANTKKPPGLRQGADSLVLWGRVSEAGWEFLLSSFPLLISQKP